MLTSAMIVAIAVALLQAPPASAAAGARSPLRSVAAGAPAEPQASALDPDQLPVSIDRIQRAINETPRLRMDLGRPVFRTEVIGRRPTIEDILGPDFARGRANYGGLTHQEFLDMVTPQDVAGYAAFSNGEGFTVAATSFLMQWALQKAMAKFRDARTAREREAARLEVEEALRDLDRARAKAGLPPR